MDEMMQAAPAAQTMGDAVKSAMVRDPGTVPESRKALVDEWAKRIKEAKKHWEPDFKRMRTNMDFNSGKQWPGQGTDDDRYVANFTQRIIKQEVASLYAKNPKVVAKRRKRMNYRLWDGKPESLQAAMQAMQPPQVVDPVTGQAMPAPGSETP